MFKNTVLKQNFTKEFVDIWEKQNKKTSNYDVLKVIDDIRKEQKPEEDDKTEIDNMIIEEIKKFNANSFSKTNKNDLKLKEKLTSMKGLLEIPRIENTFNNTLEETIMQTRPNIGNDSYLSKNFSTKNEEKVSQCNYFFNVFLYYKIILIVKSKLRRIDDIINSSNILKKSANLNIMNTTTNKDFPKSFLKNTNITTNYRTTFMNDTLQTQISNNTYDDFLLVKNSEFKNPKEYKKHLGSLSKNKTVNSLMNHIVNNCFFYF